MRAQPDDRLTPAEKAADGRANYDVALHALSGVRPTHDDPAGANGVIARNLADLLIARGVDLDGIAMVGVLLRAEGYRRIRAARAIEKITAGAGKLGLGVPESERLIPRNAPSTEA